MKKFSDSLIVLQFLLLGLFCPVSLAQSDSTFSVVEIKPKFTFPVIPYPNPEFNFYPVWSRYPTEDLNGDGVSDFYAYIETYDDRTDDPGDSVWKTLIWYGNGNFDKDPDTLFYKLVIPIGDLNDDGEVDYIESDDNFSGSSRVIINGNLIFENDFGRVFSQLDIKSFNDFDHDGFQDALIYNLHSDSSKALFIWGGNSSANIKTQWFYPELVDGIKRDEYSEVVTSFGYSSESNEKLVMLYPSDEDAFTETGVSVFEITSEKEIELFQTFTLPDIDNSGETTVMFIYDYNNDGAPDLFFNSEGSSSSHGTYKIDGVNTTGKIFDDNSLPIESERLTDYYLEPIGDFDKDGKLDLIKRTNNRITNLELVELSENGDLVSSITVYDNSEQSLSKERHLGYRVTHPKVDLNNDGFDDVIFETRDENRNTLTRVIYGNSQRNTSSVAEFIHKDATPHDYVNSTTNLGDINNDGIEDFGFIKNENSLYDSVFEIYIGGNSDYSQPDFIINSERSGDYFSSPKSADFNGDGHADILLVRYSLIQYSTWIIYLPDLLFFYGGSDFNGVPDLEVEFETYSDVEITGQSIELHVFIPGDVNNDGKDDFILKVDDSDLSYLYFGGEDIFGTAPLEINFNIHHAEKIGDIDQDGFDDFALGNPIIYAEDEVGTGSYGVVRIYSSFNDNRSTLGDEFYELKVPLDKDGSRISNFGISLASGDFTGDGVPDLGVLAREHYRDVLEGDKIGEGGIYIYKGGEEFSDSSFYSLGIPSALFLKDGEQYYGGDYLINSAGAILTSVPDVNKDGMDEFMFHNKPKSFLPSQRNAVVFLGRDIDENEIQSYLLMKNPNPVRNFGPIYQSPAVGEFGGAKGIDILMPQIWDRNNLSDPVYWFEILPNQVSTEEIVETVSQFKLMQNYPNPFNPTTNINYSLTRSSNVKLTVYDLLGREVEVLIDKQQNTGSYSVSFNASSLASGVYFYRLETSEGSLSKKMLLIK